MFLNAKHWQIFLLTFGIPMLLQLFFIASIFQSINADTPPDSDFILRYLLFFPILMIFFTAVFFGWFWSVGVGLDKKIPEHLKLNVGRFKKILLFPFVYILLISGFIGYIFSGGLLFENEPNFSVFGLIFLLHIGSMIAIFYSLYFVAKTIKTAELQKPVSFGDFAGEFFLIWFFPVGVWIVQPKINEMVRERDEFDAEI